MQNKVVFFKKKKKKKQLQTNRLIQFYLAQSKNLTKPEFGLTRTSSMFVQTSFDSGKKLMMYFTFILQP